MNLLSLWNVHVQTDRANVSSYIGFKYLVVWNSKVWVWILPLLVLQIV